MALRRRGVAVVLALGLSGPAQCDGLEALVGSLLTVAQMEGSLDLARWSCRQATGGNGSIQGCRGPVSGLGFLHLREEGARDVSCGGQGSGGADRAALDRLEAEFMALLDVAPCPAFVVKSMPSSLPVALAFGEPDDASAADPDAPGKAGAIRSAIAIPVRSGFDGGPQEWSDMPAQVAMRQTGAGNCQGFASIVWFSQGTNFEMLV